ncbi:MAG: twin-arginine translocase subunit TatB [Alcaligenaceae bacterium]|nr:twin-arginine translocase subunit TatB [Alcaligenaceae bacterium]
MFGLSFSELFVIGLVALIVIGPERLPKVARTVGHLLGRAQRYVNDVKSDIQREVDIQEISKIKNEMQASVQDMKTSFEETAQSLRNPVDQLKQELVSAEEEVKKNLSNASNDSPGLPGQQVTAETTPDNPKTENKPGSGISS